MQMKPKVQLKYHIPGVKNFCTCKMLWPI